MDGKTMRLGETGRWRAHLRALSATRRVALPFAIAAAAITLLAAPNAVAQQKKTAISQQEPAKPATIKISGQYASPKSATRPVRKQTSFIILHTTEGAAKGALEKLRKNGECHYVIDKDGSIYRIVDRRKVAFHCGRSMWEGKTNLDSTSIGIELVGSHNKDITSKQYESLKFLVADLKRTYKVPDNRILTHSMVAYGAPNRWQKKSHRGRKRCGMLLADSGNRRKFGVYSKPLYDPDIRSRRLVDADPELTLRLYSSSKEPVEAAATEQQNVISLKRSAWDIARDLYDAETTTYFFPNGTKKNGKEIKNWKAMPAGTKVVVGEADEENPEEEPMAVGVDGTTPDIAGDEANASTTFYFIPEQKTYKRGSEMTPEEIAAVPQGTRVLVGYDVGGPISASSPAFSVCGAHWNQQDTFYLTPKGDFIAGNLVNERAIPRGSLIFFKK